MSIIMNRGLTNSFDLWYNNCWGIATKIPSVTVVAAREAAFSFLGGAPVPSKHPRGGWSRGDAAHPIGAAMIPADLAVALDDYEDRMKRFWSNVLCPLLPDEYIDPAAMWVYLLGEEISPEERLFIAILNDGWLEHKKHPSDDSARFVSETADIFLQVMGLRPATGKAWLDYVYSEANMAKARGKGKGGKGKGRGC